MVSHDRYFLNRVCTRVLAFEDDGMLYHNVGSYDYYLEKKAEREQHRQEYAKVAASHNTKQPAKAEQGERPRKLKWSEERELETIEEDILAAEEAASAQQAIINDPQFYSNHSNDYRDYELKLERMELKVMELYERWEELNQVKAACDAYQQ